MRYNSSMNKQKTMSSSIRLPVETWQKFRALFQYHGANSHVKTGWLVTYIDKKYQQMEDKKNANSSDIKG